MTATAATPGDGDRMPGRGERGRRANIVRYWRAVEMFSPQKVGKPAPRTGMHPVDATTPPWDPSHPSRRQPIAPTMTRQHTVYCGVYPIASVRDVLLDVFGGDAEDHDGRLDGDSAMLAFEVTDEGLLIQDSLTFSACAWATGRARKPGPGSRSWLEGFEEEAGECERTVLQLGDGKLDIVDLAPRGATAFAGLACRLAAETVGGALVPGLAPVLGEMAAGLLADAALRRTAAAVAARPHDTAVPDTGTADADDAPDIADADDDNDDNDDDDNDDEATDAPRLGHTPLTVRHLSALTRWLADRFGVTDDLRPHTVRVQTRLVSQRKAGRAGGSDFLNSFIAADLDLVARKLDARDPGRALTEYLTASAAIRTADRVDLREHPEAVLAGVHPTRFPLGRWPARTEHPLVLSQQFAVNAIMERLADGEGLYAVNGPPGTGKTTQLRDLVAAVLVRRAERLAELARPDDAFRDAPLRWSTGGYPRSLRRLKPELTGHEMVIASANNGAVENVSMELPAAASVADEWRDEASFFPEQGGLLLGGEPAWGTLAARLGNKGNRQEFRNAYWFGPPKPKNRARGRDRAAGAGPVPPAEEIPGMRELLGRAAAQGAAPADWRDAVRRFREARRTVRELQEERGRAADAFEAYEECRAAVERLGRAVDAAGRTLRALREPLARARAERLTAQTVLEDRAERRDRHEETRPGLPAVVFSLGGARRTWESEHRLLTEAVRHARTAAEDATRRLAAQERAEHLARAEHTRLSGELDGARARAAGVERTTADAARRWGPYLPGAGESGAPGGPGPGPGAPGASGAEAPGARTPEDLRELSSPWSDPEFTRARTRLFLAATDLHRAFLLGAADRMRKNLDAAMDVLCGDAPATLPAATVLAAWQNLFLAVPVVSTTFASLDRMFTGLGPGALGWTLIDEAGQATAQMPVGALWRSRRAVVVGDPLQLEPVVALPHTGSQALRRTYGVDEEWSPSRTSAQRVADRLNPYGTWLPAPDDSGTGRVWVGSPLRVHRRCDEPMFGISNEIAYEGLMVHGVARSDDYAVARRGVWWHVPAGTAEGKWSPAEGEAANVIVHRLMDQGLEPGEIFVVSPFRDVVAGLSRSLCRAVPRERIGTVHTTQGKEADVVLLVLGSAARPGPRVWAASTPNLLNVAVSRARRRLFVVGDHDAWRTHRHFDVLARDLPLTSPEDRTRMRTLAPARLPHPCRC
ncbi:AAA domain-containing protein [Streptomyces sp. NPDC014894]|uniref:AAA domain-containing protein n=1 Tax=Streptomyces sp. NPDC014894 TaxID=3364931 RepID=UPI003701D5D6